MRDLLATRTEALATGRPCVPRGASSPDAEGPSKGGTSASGHGRGLERAPRRSRAWRAPGRQSGASRPSSRHPVYSFTGTVATSSCVALVMVHVQSVPSFLTARARP